MARKARVKSSTGIYHVLIRAIANLSLFSDEEDYSVYISSLNDLQLQGRCEVYAYALFPTHVHLLVREGIPQESSLSSSSSLEEPIGSVMKRLAAAYSYFFNVKYEHYGPIYLDRFKSNPVETRDYFLKVLDHIGSQQTEWKMTTSRIPSGLASSPLGELEGALLDYRIREKRITDSGLMYFLQQNYAFTNIGEFLQRSDEDIKDTIKAAKDVGGSIRQIARLTGCPYQMIFSVK